MALTAKQIYDLDNCMVAGQNVALGTLLNSIITGAAGGGVVRGSYTVLAADDTANKIVIASGLAAIIGWSVAIYRSGVDVTNNAVITVVSTTNLQIADSTYQATAGDVVKYIIW